MFPLVIFIYSYKIFLSGSSAENIGDKIHIIHCSCKTVFIIKNKNSTSFFFEQSHGKLDDRGIFTHDQFFRNRDHDLFHQGFILFLEQGFKGFKTGKEVEIIHTHDIIRENGSEDLFAAGKPHYTVIVIHNRYFIIFFFCNNIQKFAYGVTAFDSKYIFLHYVFGTKRTLHFHFGRIEYPEELFCIFCRGKDIEFCRRGKYKSCKRRKDLEIDDRGVFRNKITDDNFGFLFVIFSDIL